jgi:hypothetical protein
MSKYVPAFARRAAATAVFLAAALAGSTALALPERGSARPDCPIADAWDRSTTLGRFAGMPMLVIYEDKSSVKLNDALKAELTALAKTANYEKVVALIAVADVSDYDHWPLRTLVKSEIKRESRKNGVSIYCDWDGGVRGTLDLPRKTSNVVLYGRDGRVLFARSGRLSDAERAELISLLRNQVDGPTTQL